MVERPKGNLLYEILIVVLVFVLIGTILYPRKVWKNEEEMENVCHTRMETLQHLEVQYLFNQNVYSDSISEVLENVRADEQALMSLDSLVQWDGVLVQSEMKKLFSEKNFPEDLRAQIQEKLKERQPLGNLTAWDDLEYKLLDLLKETLNDSTAVPDSLDHHTIWPLLFGETQFFKLIENVEMSSRVRQQTRSAINRGTSVIDTRGWSSIRPVFINALEKVMQVAENENIWKKEDKDEWEDKMQVVWNTNMDTLEQAERDSLWQANKRSLWDKGKELIWMKERVKLWKSEGKAWAEANSETWKRVVDEQWEKERKRNWLKNDGEDLPDSLKLIFQAKKDSLWRTVIDELREKDFKGWARKNQDKVIQELYENERRLTWEQERYIQWTEEKESNKDELWESLKEDLWKLQKDDLWRDEEEKTSGKRGALRRLDVAIAWVPVLGEERVNNVVQNLQLPDNEHLFKKYLETKKERTKTHGSALNDLGLAPLFRDQLIEASLSCPVAESPYLVVTPDSLKKAFEVHCPISDTSKTVYTIQIDPVTKDTTTVNLKVPFGRKLFGGAKIKNHGNIDRDGKQSWKKKGQ